jgi:hypothetical protein
LLLDGDVVVDLIFEGVVLSNTQKEDHQEEEDRQHKEEDDRKFENVTELVNHDCVYAARLLF